MILLIDNYDSFTFNLYQELAAIADASNVRVIRNDAMTAAEVVALGPSHVITSPGPGHPRDSRLSLELPDALPRAPLLGICLGHQALALAAGAQVGRSARPVHGSTLAIRHDGGWPFAALPQPFDAALYHSLVVDPDSLPLSLRQAAWSPAGDIMALRHAERPHVGVQFHPESFMTPVGRSILGAFLEA